MRARSRPDPASPSAHQDGTGERPADRYRAQLATLADIAAQASCLQPPTEAAIRACGSVATVPDSVALELGRLSRRYSRLYEDARHLPVEPELKRRRDELTRVLSYHLHMLRDAGDMAFSGRRDARTEPFRRELAAGLGDYATQLLVIADQLRTRLLAPHTDDEPAPGPGTAPDELDLGDVELFADDTDPGPPPP